MRSRASCELASVCADGGDCLKLIGAIRERTEGENREGSRRNRGEGSRRNRGEKEEKGVSLGEN